MSKKKRAIKMTPELEKRIQEIEVWEIHKLQKREEKKEIETPISTPNERISIEEFVESFEGIGVG